MKKIFCPAVRKNPALVLSFGAALVWLLSSCWLSGKDGSPGKDVEAYLKSGVRDYKSGARQRAIEEFTRAIELDPTRSVGYAARATALFQMKDYAGAIKDCDKVIGLGHDGVGPTADWRSHIVDAYLIKGECRYYLHDVQGALQSLDTAISMNPDDPLVWVIRGGTLVESREWDGAIVDFSKAIGQDPEDAMAYYGRATAECFLEDYENSLANVSRAIQLDKTLSNAYGLRAEIETHLKDRAGAFADANAGIQLDKSDEKGYATRADIEAMWDDFPDASNDLQTAIQINPTSSEIYLIRGRIEQKCGNFQSALADYSRGLANGTGSIDTDIAYESMGYDYAEMDQWKPALESFRKAMAFKSPPDDAPFQVFLIECRMGQTRQAKKELAVYIQSIPAAKAGDWTTCIAHFLAGTLNENSFFTLAATTAKRPTDVAQQTGDAGYYAGMQHLLAGDKPGALKRLKKSLKVGDDNSDNYTMARSVLGESVGNQLSAKLGKY